MLVSRFPASYWLSAPVDHLDDLQPAGHVGRLGMCVVRDDGSPTCV
jgi:hypothetical protein